MAAHGSALSLSDHPAVRAISLHQIRFGELIAGIATLVRGLQRIAGIKRGRGHRNGLALCDVDTGCPADVAALRTSHVTSCLCRDNPLDRSPDHRLRTLHGTSPC